MSGVEPNLLQTAFDTFKEATVCEDCEFIMNIQKDKRYFKRLDTLAKKYDIKIFIIEKEN